MTRFRSEAPELVARCARWLAVSWEHVDRGTGELFWRELLGEAEAFLAELQGGRRGERARQWLKERSKGRREAAERRKRRAGTRVVRAGQ